MDKSSSNSLFIDLAGVVAAIAVVILHTNGCFWDFSATERYWFTANIIESVFYFGVPVFFMITGATLMDFQERYGIRQFYGKRAKKTMIPYIFWSVFGILFHIMYIHDYSWKEMTSVPTLLRHLVKNDVISLYWFFTPLFCVYLSIPLFASVPKEKRNATFSVIAALSFAFNIAIPFVLSVTNAGIRNPLKVVVGQDYLFYIMIGYLICTNELPRKAKIWILVLGICGVAAHIGGTYYQSIADGKISRLYKGYTNLPSVLYSTAVFVWLKEISGRLCGTWLEKIIKCLRKYTFGLYLVQYYIMYQIVSRFGVNRFGILYRFLVGPAAVILIGIGCIWLIRKLPFGKYILP